MARAAALAAVAALLLAAPAHASTVHVANHIADDIRPDVDSFSSVRFQAAAGERNRVIVGTGAPGVIVIVDRGARLLAGHGCRRVSRHRARCRYRQSADIEPVFSAHLGDGDDTFHDRADDSVPFFHVHAGRGNDRLIGGAGVDFLYGEGGRDVIRAGASGDLLDGGPGADQLDGGPGRDRLRDGDGRDVVRGGPGRDRMVSDDTHPVADRFFGGAGRDDLSYGSRSARVRATIGGTAGVAGEGDTLRSVEGLRGGRAADVLRGSPGPDELDGGQGSDRLYGGAGDDILRPGQGRNDRVFAGAGDDTIGYSDYDGVTADVRCGPGLDTSTVSGFGTLLRPDCERSGTLPAQPLRVTRRAVVMTLPCAFRAKASDAQLVVPQPRPWFRSGSFGTVVARATRPVRKGDCRTRFTLTGAGLHLHRPVPVRVKFHDRYATWAFLLEAPGATTR